MELSTETQVPVTLFRLDDGSVRIIQGHDSVAFENPHRILATQQQVEILLSSTLDPMNIERRAGVVDELLSTVKS